MSLHVMPYGAALGSDGRARFRFWAPGQSRVGLRLAGHGEPRPMPAVGEGWFELTTDAVAGEPYAFVLEDGREVPDPASRRQAGDVHGPSLVTDPNAYRWRHSEWRGRPWAETVLYELHLGTFTPEGTFDSAKAKLPHLAELGVTAVELMPVADFPGMRNWGYDGVLPYAPATAYGSPDALKAFVDEAHGLGLMVFLDVVYNHFGPDGNYLSLYAPDFFTEDFHTPWGAAIDFRKQPVRDFFVHNALYWLDEFRFDGLRFDAVHAIVDPSPTHILKELALRVRDEIEKDGREVHLVLENEANQAGFLQPDGEVGRLYDAQWNDDAHHVHHVLLTGEGVGYYEDYAERPMEQLVRSLAEGFVYQGEASRHGKGRLRGEPSAELSPLAFVDFLQNHDQVGNRALGERLTVLAPSRAVQAWQSLLLLTPHVPLLFMGEEWGTEVPFQFFCDFHGELGRAVQAGRFREFAGFFAAHPEATVPDPIDEATFTRSKLDWGECQRSPHEEWLARTRLLLRLRKEQLAPRLLAGRTRSLGMEQVGERGLRGGWQLGDGSRLHLLAQLGPEELDGLATPPGQALHASAEEVSPALAAGRLPGWSVAWFLEPA